MAIYIVRRLIAAVFILLAASFLVYMLMTRAGNPLEFTLSIQNPTQRAQTIRQVTETLSLDKHPLERYWDWLTRLIVGGEGGHFGEHSRTLLPIGDDLARRLPLTLKLVMAAAVGSVVVGVIIGIVTALRQYSGFDYLVTFVTFVFFSLPVFWVAVILKAWGGINFNDWLRDGAHFSVEFIVVAAALAAIVGYSIAGGQWQRKAMFAGGSAAGVAALLAWISGHGWMLNPGLGPFVFALAAIAIAVGVTAVMAGLRNVRARNAALITAAVGIVAYFPLQSVFDRDDINLWMVLGLGVIAIAVGVAVGYAVGGYDKGQSARTAALVAFLMSGVMFVDRAMQSWREYSESPIIRNRPIKTIGDREARLEGSFWVITNDTFSHLVLPTLALMLISVASYTRYSRASMLEVLNQDYIRTARAKGLTERTVVMRHAFRNALIPLATIVAFDTAGVVGGAVITETVFQWDGMGRLFIDGLVDIDPNRVMAFFVVTALFAVIFNLIADILYASLDPRIRIGD
ncbi:MAG: ABC transporter permease [Desertimonas sp.]